jgi:hypothetical protein
MPLLRAAENHEVLLRQEIPGRFPFKAAGLHLFAGLFLGSAGRPV